MALSGPGMDATRRRRDHDGGDDADDGGYVALAPVDWPDVDDDERQPPRRRRYVQRLVALGLPAPTGPVEILVPFLPSGWNAPAMTVIDETLPPFAVMPLPVTAVKGYQPDPRPEADAIAGGGQAAPAQPVATRTAFGNLEPPPL